MSTPLDPLIGAVLGALQGATEFLPVSSDGHIALGAMLFGLRETPLAMTIMLHVGTLIATVLVLAPEARGVVSASLGALRRPRALLETDDGRTALAVVVASVPTAILGLSLRDAVDELDQIAWVVGLCFLGSAVAAASTRRSSGAARTVPPGGIEVPTLGVAILIGIAQGLAVLPGLSRSGSTIACAMLLGMSGPGAFRFSFLLSLPAVFGAVLLELRHPDELAALGAGVWIGAAVAFVVGFAALRWLRTIVARGRFWLFALYLVPLGLAMIAWDLTR